ncbi:MAG: extracellular solute-binding protein [Candidatus Binatia bacterium]
MRFTPIVLLSLWLHLWSWDVRAQEDLIAQAKREQELVIYGTAQAHQVQNYLKNFRKQYPFLQIKYSRSTGETLTSKILAEASGGQSSADIVIINNYTHRIFMKKNMLAPHLTPAVKGFPQGLADPEGYWTGLYIVPYAIEYNSKMVAKHDVPKSYDDLLQPRWKGQMSLEKEEYLVTQAHAQFLGKERALEFFRKLARQDLALVKGHSQQTVLLSAGEFPLVVYNDIARSEEYKKKGAPVAWVDAEPHITVVVAAGMLKLSRHPNAAKLFLNFIASDEGQKEVLAMDKPSALPKFRPDYLKGVRLYPVDWTLSDSYEDHNKLFRDIFWK